jgi:hypothetical protein
MADYTITVKRNSKSGTLSFISGDISVSTECWWDPDNVIVANADGYLCCATRMHSAKDSVTKEKRPGIWFGKGIKYNHGTKTGDGAFIHEGTGASWSKGCIVARRPEVMRIWNAISPQGEFNILVKIVDPSPVG